MGDGSAAKLQDSNQYAYNVVEGGAVGLNGYTFLAAAEGFERIVQVTSIDATNATSGGSNDKGKVVLRDVISGTEFEINVDETATAGVFQGKKVIDGQDYYIYLDTKGDTDVSNDEVYITWGTNANYNDVGSEITVYPIMRTSKGAVIALSKPVTLTFGLGEAKTIKLPTGDVSVSTSTDGNVTVSIGGTQIISTSGSAVTQTASVGSVQYNFTATPDQTNPTLAITLAATNNPALQIIEEKDANDNQNAVIIPVASDSTGATYTDLQKPVLTGTNSGFKATGDNEDKAVDVYGVTVYRTNTNDQDNIVITYPDNQLTAAVAVGSNPQFGTATSEVTRDVVVPVTQDIAYLDTQVTEEMKQNYDLIVVGGPCVNRVAAELLGKTFPACGADSGIPENAALVKVFPNAFAEGKTAVLVAGWSAENTKKACTMIQSGALEGKDVAAVKIVDSTIEEITVEEAGTEETAAE